MTPAEKLAEIRRLRRADRRSRRPRGIRPPAPVVTDPAALAVYGEK